MQRVRGIHIHPHATGIPVGTELLHDPHLNKGTAFTEEERDVLRLRGLLPPRVFTEEEQVLRVLENLRRKPNDLEKYVFLTSLQDRNETLFYRVVMGNLEETMPLIYTPTVGQACMEYGHIFRRPRGLFISIHDRGRIADMLDNWPESDVRVIVVTDGERILGLGDLGADGMGIPVGKLSLYTACAGIHPEQCLPVTLDVGTSNVAFRDDPLYIGVQEPRVRGAAYDELIEEFVTAVQERFPHALIQFEDFATENAFRLLERYRDRVCTFNDDIQGTATVVLAGLWSALRITGEPLCEQEILFLGAGEAAIGIANLVVEQLVLEGFDEQEARRRLWFIDSKGLVVQSRTDLAIHKRPFAHLHEPITDVREAIEDIRPSVLIGASGQPGIFSQQVIEQMAYRNERPIVFALSNPTSKAECTAEQAYRWSQGRAIFASGSPFPPVEWEGNTFVPGQANNSYVFPGVGLGVVLSEARYVTDAMFLAAARALASLVTEEDLHAGRVYPPLSHIREASAAIATAVMEVAYEQDLAQRSRPDDLLRYVEASMYQPEYVDYLELETVQVNG